MIVKSINSMGLATKLAINVLIIVGLLFGLFVTVVGYSISNLVENSANAQITEKTTLVVKLIGSSEGDLRARIGALMRVFSKSLPGKFELDSTPAAINGKPVPVLKLNDEVLNLNFTAVDRFSANTGAVCTLFAKSGEEFIRITTSLKNEKLERAVGTQLDHGNPAYAAIIGGNKFVGNAKLFGRNYMTEYDPILDEKGNVIGLTFVGVDVTDYLNELKSTIRGIKVGETGYFYVLDAKPGKTYGDLIVHPAKEGSNILAAKDADGHEFIKEILDRKNGLIRYPWINTELNETTPREKVVAYSYLPAFNWVVAGGTYVEEYTRGVLHLRNVFAFAGCIFVLIISSALFLLIKKQIIRPLGQASEAAKLLAEGDLRINLPDHRGDEIGTLMDSMNSIGSNLTDVVEKVRERAAHVASASREIAVGNNDLSRRTEQQAGTLEETASAVEELTATVKANADSAQQANQMAMKAAEVASNGGKVVSEVVITMGTINASSRKIVDIISVIDSIAFQTNILALNAAVEAARAGEQGRGFAVVASEVRLLAQRSAAAAGEIKTLIGDSVRTVEAGTNLVDRAGASMIDTVKSIESLRDLVSRISHASNEQSTGIEQVSRAIVEIDNTTQQNAALVEQASAAAESMTEQAANLEQLVQTFKT
ncbi:methyl-accepting chemotaxis protein [Oxalobacteraceae bacterium GrIS 2.11]